MNILNSSVKDKPILCKLKGPVADTINPTRNGRLYNEELWDNAKNDPIVQEMVENGGFLLQLGHPKGEDQEIDLEKVAAVMPDFPTKGKDGKLFGEVCILDTPMGRIANTLAQFGYKLGISSRGSGDVVESYGDVAEVDPETYELTTWDLVVLPAVKDARLQMVESLGKTLQETLHKNIMKETEKDRHNIIEALDKFGIKYECAKNTETVDDSTHLLNSLNESLKQNKEMKSKLAKINSQLVEEINSKGALLDENNKLKEGLKSLSDRSKKYKALQKIVASKDKEFADLEESYNATLHLYKKNHRRYLESMRKTKALEEKLENQSVRNKSLRTLMMKTLKEQKQESSKKDIEQFSKIRKLEEQVENLTKKLNKLDEQYNKLGNKYIDVRSSLSGLDSKQVKGSLKENFSIKDVDDICNKLKSRSAKLDKLPFNPLSSDNIVSTKKLIMKESLEEEYLDPTDILLDQMYNI